jgi:hypothetical protein
LLQASWSVQGYEFHTDLKVLILQNFDMILGMDWLELHSPMKVHWAHKCLAISYASKIVTLEGIIPGALDCSNIELVHISLVSPSEQVVPAVQQVLDKFQDVFRHLQNCHLEGCVITRYLLFQELVLCLPDHTDIHQLSKMN